MRIKVKRMIALPLIVILMFTSSLYTYPRQAEAKESNIYQGEGFEVTFCLDSVYDGGYHARLELTNKTSHTIEDWTLVFSFYENISGAWNGTLSKLDDGTYQIQNAGWNQDILAGETVTFGFSGSSMQTPKAPSDYKLVGAQCTADPNEYDVTCDLVEQWSSGYIVKVNIANLTAFTMKDWMLEFTSQNALESVWGASISTHSDRTYQVRNDNNNQNIFAYSTVSFNCMVTSSTYIEPCNFKLFYQSLDSTLLESLAPTTSSGIEKPIISVEPTVTVELPTVSPTESVLPTESEIPVISESPIPSEHPSETKEPEEEMDMTDTDGDGLIDVLEEFIGTDPLMKDTDGDFLTDYEEAYLVGTNPILIDSNGNGIMDANDDMELDGLANKDELDIGTSATNRDTDYDGLNDGEEVKQYGTDPLNEDTDGDTITDGDEILLGLNPLLADSDGDGIADNKEKIEQTFSAAIEDEEKLEVTKVEVAFAGTGNIQNTTEIASVYGEDVYSSELVGLVGAPIEIETESEFDKATITFSYEESKLGEVKEEDLAIMWYDEENYDYVMMDSIVDKENHTVSCDTTHFSVYTLIDKKAWKAFWSEPIPYHYLNYMDIAVVCENTSEMFDLADVTTMIGTNVASNITMLDHICEIEYGEDACVEFEFGRESEFSRDEINEDFYDALVYRARKNGKYAVDKGYNVSKGIELAIDELNRLNSGNEKAILLLCSGEELDDIEEVVRLAKQYDISITTVDFDNEKRYSSVLKNAAEETGGKYLDISAYNFDIYEDLCEIATNAVESFRRNRMKDADGDGIFDIYELYGIKASNGTIIKTDYKKADTDGDGLTDSEEMNVEENAESGEVVAYPCSYPTAKDSDSDGLSDSEDPYPKTSKGDNFTIVDSFSHFPDVKTVRDKIVKDVRDYNNQEGIYKNVSVSKEEEKELKGIRFDAKIQYTIACAGKLQSGNLLRHYINGNGELYNIPISGMITTSKNVQDHFVNNVYRMLKACKRSVKSGYTQRIVTAYSPKTGENFPFSNITSSVKTVLTEFDLFAGINDAEAGIICECTKVGGRYKVELRYYLLDYYDFDRRISDEIGGVSPSQLYRLNQVGMARNFEVRGCETYRFIFNDQQDLKSVIKKHL